MSAELADDDTEPDARDRKRSCRMHYRMKSRGGSNERALAAEVYSFRFSIPSTGGQALNFAHSLWPVSNVIASGCWSDPLSFSQYANHGTSIFWRKYRDGSSPNSTGPSDFPLAPQPP